MAFKSVFITGASSGLGRGLALHYAKSGATVHACARRRASLEEMAREAPTLIPVELDVGDLDALTAAIARAEEASGGALDLVIANAGISEPSLATDLDWKTVQRTLHINATAACVTVSAALPAMVARKQGQVVAVSSVGGYRGLPGGHAAYCASKAAVHRFLEGLRIDLRGSGVTATTISPGFVKTDLTAKAQFPLPFLMELDDAVRVMARAIERKRSRLVYPFPTAWAMRLLGVIPAAIYEPVASLFRSMANMRPLLLLLALCGCPKSSTENPYKDVTPKKVKEKVEQIQKQEDERNDKRLEEAQKQ